MSRESLLRAGISDAEIVVLATNNDETNLLGCAFAKKVFGEQVGDRRSSGLTTIAKIRDPTLLDHSKGAGPLENWSRADHVVCASDEIVDQLAAGLLAPSIDEILPLGGTSWIAVSEVMSNSPFIGTKAGQVLSLIQLSEPTRLMRNSYAVFCSTKKNNYRKSNTIKTTTLSTI